ncbi:MAG: hybrid sensor histidine kinase/response regulator [Rhodospirillaceae bacterium]|nr:hybrid sensor histidine kinase/response regulator [Rhodospirillaceae bacterium]MBT5455011.1 hybrid sensor histidine kinase/response regulator [Rhodospirillaceae bacterium]
MAKAENWKVLIVDDDRDVHEVTRLALHDFEFDDRQLDFISGYSSEDGRDIVQDNPDAAILLLDIVMETDQAGLQLVEYVRKEAANDQMRIVLRTGQPGKAPEQKIVRDYDINDYREKMDLTAQKLDTLMHATLRSFRDIVRLKEQGAELREAEQAAQEASRAKSRFIANMSHEMRTPLNGIIGLSGMMADEVLGPLGHPKYKEYSWDIKSSSENLLTVIENVLEVADDNLARRPLHEVTFNLSEMIQDCLSQLKDSPYERNEQNNTKKGAGFELKADKEDVRRMLVNLLSNALKARSGEGWVRVGIGVRRNSDLVISINDNGPGISDEVIKRLGEPFAMKGDAYVAEEGSTGLGLAITKRLIERHGGKLQFRKPSGGGTSAQLVFPAERVVTYPPARTKK